jgi:hypothetical protein
MRLEHDCARAVAPDTFERELEPPVGSKLEPILSERRTSDVTAKPLELPAIPPINKLLRVNIDAAHFGDRRIGIGRNRRVLGPILRDDQPERGLVRLHRGAPSCRRVAGGKTRLVAAELELGGHVVLHLGVETAAVRAENFLDPLGGATRNGRDFCTSRRLERMKTSKPLLSSRT